MTTRPMIIGGAPAPVQATFDVVNPATGEVFAQAPDCTPQQLDAAFEAAATAFTTWRADEDQRRATLLKIGEMIVGHGDQLTDLMVTETGKPWELANLEIRSCQMWLQYFADVEIPRDVIADDDMARIEMAHRPLGVVAAISPWNFPLATPMNKVAPALRAGNTVVVKPSPFTPLTMLWVGELLAEVLPPGVVTVVTGGDELGAAMTNHPIPRKVAFTGSIAAGKRVAQAAAADLKRMTLELGGNDAAIILDDADIAVAVPAVLERAFFNCGQTCAVPKRIFAPESIYDDVVDAFTAAARAMTLGAGREGRMGPLSTPPQYTRVQELVGDALGRGVTATTGGQAAARPGFFFEPTILTGAQQGMRIVDEEQFGPALPVMPYRDVDEALAMANSTMFGLAGSVWTSDLERGQVVAERMECGATYVNAHGVHRPSMPMLGVKWSGMGVEHGIQGLLEYTDPQVVYVAAMTTDTALTEMGDRS